MATTNGKTIDAAYLERQLKNFEAQIIKARYNKKFQLDTMPIASVDYIGDCVQYLGATDEIYTHGFFYEVKAEVTPEGTVYRWISVSADVPEYTIKKEDVAEEGYAATYKLMRDDAAVGAAINIPKDFFLKDAACAIVTEGDKANGGKFEGNDDYTIGDAYLDLSVNIDDGGEGTVKHVYVNVSNLVDVYTNGNGAIKVENNKISLAVKENAGLAIDESGAKVVGNSAAGITVDADGIKVNINAIDSGLQYDTINGAVKVKTGPGLKIDTDTNAVVTNLAELGGLEVDGIDKLGIKLHQKSGLAVFYDDKGLGIDYNTASLKVEDDGTLAVKLSTNKGIDLDNTNGLSVQLDECLKFTNDGKITLVTEDTDIDFSTWE